MLSRRTSIGEPVSQSYGNGCGKGIPVVVTGGGASVVGTNVVGSNVVGNNVVGTNVVGANVTPPTIGGGSVNGTGGRFGTGTASGIGVVA